MDAIRKIASEFLLEHKVDQLRMGLDGLQTLCDKIPCELLTYSQGRPIIEQYHLQSHTVLDAFLFSCNGTNIIFYSDVIPYSQKLYSIAHEMGHLCLKHSLYQSSAPDTDPIQINQNADPQRNRQEAEADAFAYGILAPACVLRACRARTIADIKRLTLLDGRPTADIMEILEHYRPTPEDSALLHQYRGFIRSCRRTRTPLPLILAAAVIALLAAIGLYAHFSQDTAPLSPDVPAAGTVTSPLPSDATVYITESGECYHRPECYHLLGRQSTALTLEAAVSQNYRPCKTCKPDQTE